MDSSAFNHPMPRSRLVYIVCYGGLLLAFVAGFCVGYLAH